MAQHYRRPRSRPYSVHPTSRHSSTYPVKISHLPLFCSEQDVIAKFARFGHIHSCRLHRGGGEGESYAHVNYTDRSSAIAAVQEMDSGRHIFHGQSGALRVVLQDSGAAGSTQSSSQFTLKLLHLPAVTTEAELSSVCKRLGAISVKLNKHITGNYAYANFPDRRSAEAALQYLTSYRFNGQQIKAVWHLAPGQQPHPQPAAAHYHQHPFRMGPRPPTAPSPAAAAAATSQTVKVMIHGNGITAEELRDLFSQHGTITAHPKINTGSPDYAYINYTSCDAASTAASKMADITFKGVRLTVKLSNKPGRVETDAMEVTAGGDALVNLLLTKPQYLQEARDLAQPHNVTVSCRQGGGLRLIGNQCSLPIVKSEIHRHLVSKIQELIVSERVTLPCCVLPLFGISQVFHGIEASNSVELTVQGSSLATFSATVAAKLSAEPITVDVFMPFLSQNGSSSVTWFFKNNYDKMEQFDPHSSKQLDKLYRSNQGGHLTIGSWTYTYDFKKMTQTNVTTNKIRMIARKTSGSDDRTMIISCRGKRASVSTAARKASGSDDRTMTISCRGVQASVSTAVQALKDVCKKETIQLQLPLDDPKIPDIEQVLVRFASQYFVDVEQHRSKLLITGCPGYADKVLVNLKEKRVKMLMEAQRRAAPVHVVATEPLIPDHWDPQSEDCELKAVRTGTKEWRDIEARVSESIANPQITKIERIQNKWLWKKYSLCKQHMHKKTRGNEAEKRLFHGTRDTPPHQVYKSEHGFDFRYGGNGMWGKGAYFAVNASYSVGGYCHTLSDRHRQVLMAFVLTGDSITMASGSAGSLTKPPAKFPVPGSDIVELYDSVNGETGGTRIYIVYDHDKSYPGYLITFKPNYSPFRL